MLKKPYHFWPTQRCLTILPASVSSVINIYKQFSDIDLERCETWGSLGECCWPSETPRRRAGAVDGELGAPKASLILNINVELSLKWLHPPVDRYQGHRVLLVDWPDGGDASHRVGSHDLLVAARELIWVYLTNWLDYNSIFVWEPNTARSRNLTDATWGKEAHRGLRYQLQGMDPDKDKVLTNI